MGERGFKIQKRLTPCLKRVKERQRVEWCYKSGSLASKEEEMAVMRDVLNKH